MSATTVMDISVVICTFNRARKLQKSLEELLSVRTPAGVTWEVVCVDNNSSDETKRVIEDAAAHAAVPVRYVFEPRQGLGYARNAGLQGARGRVIAMTDDDCIVASDWLEKLWRELSGNSEIDCIGGRVELYNAADLPVTLRTGRTRSELKPEGLFSCIAGCNMAFRGCAAKEVGGFDSDFGAGGKLVSAEDVEFLWRLHRAGHRVVYSPDVLVFHDHGRRTEEQRERLNASYVVGRGAFYAKYIVALDTTVARLAFWEFRGLLRGVGWGGGGRSSPVASRKMIGLLLRGALLYLGVRTGRLMQGVGRSLLVWDGKARARNSGS